MSPVQERSKWEPRHESYAIGLKRACQNGTKKQPPKLWENDFEGEKWV